MFAQSSNDTVCDLSKPLYSANERTTTTTNSQLDSDDSTREHCISKNAPLLILSFNIEGFSANKMYLELLTWRSDIIFIQEHWIHSWGKREIEDVMDILDFKSHIKCFDDNILMDPLERRRGQVGVAICYNKHIANLTVEIVVAIRINTEKPIVIICVYLPTRSHKITKDDYIMVLDELAEIVTKYRNSSDILILRRCQCLNT